MSLMSGSTGPRRLTPSRPRWTICYSTRGGRSTTIPRSGARFFRPKARRSEEHTSELQSLMRISYAVFCLKKKKQMKKQQNKMMTPLVAHQNSTTPTTHTHDSNTKDNQRASQHTD